MINKYHQMFNNKMSEFIVDLINVFPNDKDFKMFKNSFNLLKLSDERKPAEYFHKIVQPFKNEIMNRNEIFFLQKDYSDIVIEDDNNQNVPDTLIDTLKNYWNGLDIENKNIIWKYLLILLKLSEKC